MNHVGTVNDLKGKDVTTSGNDPAAVAEKVKVSRTAVWDSKFPKWREAIFLSSVGGMSFFMGFGSAISSAKKKDTDAFDKGVTPTLKSESGVALATRALRWGTFYAVTGCGLLFYCVWKMMGVQNLQEFRQKAGEMLPRIPKNDPPQSRTEFKNLTDLLQYIIDEDNKAKAETISSSSTNNVNNSNDNSIISSVDDSKSSKT